MFRWKVSTFKKIIFVEVIVLVLMLMFMNFNPISNQKSAEAVVADGRYKIINWTTMSGNAYQYVTVILQSESGEIFTINKIDSAIREGDVVNVNDGYLYKEGNTYIIKRN
jgi:hypothetical protein